ncbi:MAG: hypothetical protein CM1200mP39_16550 [Dehalococcoidia bacterium]|nr:MAG: hypothetical protein CM1200mP39_16550 [Dehalococcoidia bacterium]
MPVAVKQSPRFRGNEFTFSRMGAPFGKCAKYCPLGIIEIVSVPGKIDAQEGESYKLRYSTSILVGACSVVYV